MTRSLLVVVLLVLSALACQENGPGAASPSASANQDDAGAGPSANDRMGPPPTPMGGW